VVHRGLRAVLALAVAVTLALSAAGCGILDGDPVDAAVSLGFDRVSVVDLGPVAAAPRATTAGLEVVIVRRDGDRWVANPIAGARLAPGLDSLRLVSYDGATHEAFNTFVFGGAGEGVARVELSLDGGRGGAVSDGVWVVALPDKGLTPDDIGYRFLDASGNVVLEGRGIFPPDA
jgi:hypothetical protein